MLLAPPISVRTLGDLLHELGDIPAERVWLTPYPGTATVDDVIEAEAKWNRLCELVEGTLVEKAMGMKESRIAVVLAGLMDSHAYTQDLGIVLGADGTMRIMPGLVRIPDVSFVSWKSLPERKIPEDPIPDLVPDLAVEVLSKGNTPKEMERKVAEYFAAGVRQVWLVDDRKHTFEVFTSPTKSRIYKGEQTIKGGKLLPGFALSVDSFFKRVGLKK